MQEKKFEQQVQKGLDELAFTPSPDVWEGVEQRIARRRRRRRALIWLPLLLVGGGIGWWSLEPGVDSGEKAVVRSEAPGAKRGPSGVNREMREMREMREAPRADVEDVPLSHSTAVLPQETTASHQPTIKGNASQTITPSRWPVDDSQPPVAEVTMPTEAPGPPPEASRISRISRISPLTPHSSPLTPPASAHYEPIVGDFLIAELRDPVRKKPVYRVMAGAGISSMSNSFALLPGLQGFRDAAYANPSNNSGAPANYFSRMPSPIRPGAAFSLGVKRDLGQQGSGWSGAVGLQYQYLSTRRFVGGQYNDTVVNRGANRSALVLQSYYAASTRADEGLEYTNRYHFLAVPLQLQLRLNRSGTLRAEAGLSGTVLLGSNAVQFDTASGIYYRNRDAFRRLGASANAGMTVQALRLGRSALEVGPTLHWGLVPPVKGDRSRPVSLQLSTRIRL